MNEADNKTKVIKSDKIEILLSRSLRERQTALRPTASRLLKFHIFSLILLTISLNGTEILAVMLRKPFTDACPWKNGFILRYSRRDLLRGVNGGDGDSS